MTAERGAASFAAPPHGAVRYRLHQSFTYTYERPVSDLVHRLVVVPPRLHGDQRLVTGRVQVDAPGARVRWHEDRFANRHCVVRLRDVPLRLAMRIEVVVERGGWAGMDRPVRAGVLAALRLPSPLTGADDRIRDLAQRHAVPGDPLATADAFCALSRELIDYGYGATDVTTTAADALAAGRGVCQDHAHLMLALCRSAGIAARYVSGHLVGQGGTHAWTEVLVEGARVVAFDPCHARRADSRYVTVAVGRDYRDVPPTSGCYTGVPGSSDLATSRVLEAEPLAA